MDKVKKIYETTNPTKTDILFDMYIKRVLYNAVANFINEVTAAAKHESDVDISKYLVRLSAVQEKQLDLNAGVDVRFVRGIKRTYEITDLSLYKAIMKLAPEEREVYLLHTFDEMKDTEIAEVLNVSRFTINSRKRRSIGKVRNYVYIYHMNSISEDK